MQYNEAKLHKIQVESKGIDVILFEHLEDFKIGELIHPNYEMELFIVLTEKPRAMCDVNIHLKNLGNAQILYFLQYFK